jgi:hypothetical protein
MDFQKLDGSLAMEVENAAGEDKQIPVFVRTRTPLQQDAIRELERLRAPKLDPGSSIHTMQLSAAEVADLSDRAWVVSIRSSQKRRPLD